MTDDGDSTITSYSLEMAKEGGIFEPLYGHEVNSLSTSTLISSGISPGAQYRFRFRARNAVGWSDYSKTLYLRAASVPGAPPAPVVFSVDKESITFTLAESEENNGAVIDKHELHMWDGNPSNPYVLVESYLGVAMTYTHDYDDTNDPMSEGTIYYFKFRAHNDAGDGAFSEAVAVGLNDAAPKPTVAWDKDKSDKHTIQISWTRPANDPLKPSADIIGYRVFMDDGRKGEIKEVAHYSNAAYTKYIAAHLTPGLEYRFQV